MYFAAASKHCEIIFVFIILNSGLIEIIPVLISACLPNYVAYNIYNL